MRRAATGQNCERGPSFDKRKARARRTRATPPDVVNQPSNFRNEAFRIPPALQSLINLERERIESADRRTEVARLFIDTSDTSDKRQFDYRMAKLSADDESDRRNHGLARIVTFIASGLGIAVLALLLVMAFFGSKEQSETAIQVLKVLGIGAGGYGFIEGIIRGIGKLFQDKPK